MKMAHKALTLFVALVMVFSCVQIPVLATESAPSPAETTVVTSNEPIESAFTDTAFLAAVRELIGKTHGEHIYRSDVESITELDLVSLGIETLDGIEYFEALAELICYDNAFVTLDLSHNPNLEVLDCSYGEFLTSINVSNCPELRELDCNNTEIERLDLRQNTKLTTLYAYETKLRTLNTSNNVLLETMEVWGGHLVNLDVSNNTALTFLDCSYNNMPSSASIIGLADCTALEDDAFCFSPQDSRAVTECFTDENFLSAVREAIEKPNGDIYAEDLIEITDLSVNNSSLTSLDGIEFMSALQTLDCTSNYLEELDLYSNKALTTIQCADNDIAELDLSGNAELLTLYAANNSIIDIDVSNSVELKDVDVSDNLLTNLDLTNNVALEQLNCADNKLPSWSALILPESISSELPSDVASLSSVIEASDGFALNYFPQAAIHFIVNCSPVGTSNLSVSVKTAKHSTVKIYDITSCDLTRIPAALLGGTQFYPTRGSEHEKLITPLMSDERKLGEIKLDNTISYSDVLPFRTIRPEYKLLAVHGLNKEQDENDPAFNMDVARIVTVTNNVVNVTSISARSGSSEANFLGGGKPILITHGTVTFTVELENDEDIDQLSLEIARGSDGRRKSCILRKVADGRYQGVMYGLSGGEVNTSYWLSRADATLTVRCTYRSENPRVEHDLFTKEFSLLIDPSGYIYEGVPSNRLSGVKTTLYYMDKDGNEVGWDAAEYEQSNPIFSDNAGRYEWFVPNGLWRIKAEREGYDTFYTDWVRVPPAQMDINFGMVSNERPTIDLLCAYPEEVEVNFSKYVYADDVTASNVTVYANNQQINGAIHLENEEVDHWEGEYDQNKSGGTGTRLVSKIRFVPSTPLTLGSTVRICLSNNIRSYANVTVATNYSKESVVTVEPEQIEPTGNAGVLLDFGVYIDYGETTVKDYCVLPISASKGKKLILTNDNPFAVSVPAEIIVNENGIASIPITGLNLGDANITLALEGSNLTENMFVQVCPPQGSGSSGSGGGGSGDEVPEIPPAF